MRAVTAAGAAAAMLALFDRAAAVFGTRPPTATSAGTVGLVLGLLAAYALGGVYALRWPAAAAAIFGVAALLGHRLDATPVAAGAVGWDGVGLILVAMSLLSAGGPRRSRPRADDGGS